MAHSGHQRPAQLRSELAFLVRFFAQKMPVCGVRLQLLVMQFMGINKA